MNAALHILKQLHPTYIRKHPMAHDPISVGAIGGAVLLNVITFGLLFLRVHHVNYPVPVHYLNLVGFDQVGSWISVYRIAVFGLFVTICNAMLAAKSFHRNRVASFFLLLGAGAVSILCLVISSAFSELI